MNERMEATVICCAKLATGSTNVEIAASFVKNVKLTTWLTTSGMEVYPQIKTIATRLVAHGSASKALIEVGL